MPQSGKRRLWPKSMRGALLLLLFAVLVPAVLLQVSIYVAWFQAQRAHQAQDNLESARAVAMVFEEFTRDIRRQERAVGSALAPSRPFSPQQANQYLAACALEYPSLRALIWADPQGRVIASSDPGSAEAAPRQWECFKEVLSGREWCISDLLAGQTDADATVVIARGIRDQAGLLQGVVVAVIDPGKLGQSVFAMQVPRGGTITLFDRQGTLVYRRPEAQLSPQQRREMGHDPTLTAALSGQETAGRYVSPVDGVARLVASVPISETGWVAGADRAESDVMAPVRKNLALVSALLALVVGISVLAAWGISRRLTLPLRRLQEHAAAVGQGQLDHRAEVSGIGELAELAEGFNQMAADLKRADAEVRAQAKFPSENPSPILRIGKGQVLMYANPAGDCFLATWNCRLGQPVPEDIQRIAAAVQASGRNQETELRINDRTFSAIFVPVPEAGYVNIYARDVTEQVRATELLARSEEELRRANAVLEERVRERTAAVTAASLYARSLIEASLDPLVTISPEGKITDVNQATEQVTGVPRGRLIGSDFCDYFTQPQKAREGYRKVISEGLVRDYPLTIRHVSGSTTDVLYNAVVYRNQAGQVQGVFAAARDITQRRRAEEAVRAERQRLNDLLEMLPVYVVLLSPDYHVPFANRFFRERFGESGGRRCFEYLFGRTEPCTICETFEVLKTNAPHHWEWTGPDGRNYDIFDFPFTDADGSPLILEMGIDITERKRAEAELVKHREHLEELVRQRTAELEIANRQLQEEIAEHKQTEQTLRRTAEDLVRSNRDLEQFAYVASHDLQEPLRMVTGHLQLLQRRYQGRLDAAANDFIGFAVDGATRMATLISDLLAYSRVGTAGGSFAPADCQAVLQRALGNLRSTLEDSQAVVTNDPLPVVMGEFTQLVQLFQNLLGNALKFRSQRRPEIHVGASKHQGEWLFRVRDNGIGIEPQYFDRIFMIFQRLHGREAYGGTGIGLAICKKVVERHGGRIWVKSQPSQGSTFYFTISQVAPEAPPASAT